MKEFYKFINAPNRTDPLYDIYLYKLSKYKEEQTSYGNNPGKVLGYLYNVGDFSRTFNISKRSARRTIKRYLDGGILKILEKDDYPR